MMTKDFFTTRQFKVLVSVLGVFLVALVSFASGLAVGFHKARYSYAWGERYEQNFGKGFGENRGERLGGRGFFMMGGNGLMGGRDFRNAYGVSGAILSLSENAFIVTDRDGKENAVAVSDKTVIKNGRDTIAFGDLKTNDRVVIVGNPGDNGVVSADLIRIMGRNQ